jgi:ribonuclease Z
MRLAGAGSGAGQLGALLLTHLHSDHITDLGDVITTRWVMGFPALPLTVVGPVGTKAVVDATIASLGADISYRIAHHEDIVDPPAVGVVEVAEGLAWEAGGVRVTAAPSDHRPVAPTLAYRVEHDGRAVIIAGDTVPCATLDELAVGADLLVHTVIREDLIAPIPVQRLRDICDYHSSVEQAAQTAQKAGVRTLVLTHCVPAVVPGEEDAWRGLAAAHFDGTIEVPRDLDVVKLP